MKYAKKMAMFATITLPYMVMQVGCALDAEEIESLTISGITNAITAFFREALGDSLTAIT